MTARVKRQAVLVLTWIFVTTSATAMAWWAVTFVTTEVADRRPLRPSDVVAASLRQTVPVPTWVYGAEPVIAPLEPASNPVVAPVDDTNPAIPPSIRANGNTRVAAPATHTVHANVDAGLVARWSSASDTTRPTATTVTAPVAKVPVAATPAVEQEPAPKAVVQPLVTPPAAPTVTLQPPVVHPAVAAISVAPTPAPSAALAAPVDHATGRTSTTASYTPVAAETPVPPMTTWTFIHHPRIASGHRQQAARLATSKCSEPAPVESVTSSGTASAPRSGGDASTSG